MDTTRQFSFNKCCSYIFSYCRHYIFAKQLTWMQRFDVLKDCITESLDLLDDYYWTEKVFLGQQGREPALLSNFFIEATMECKHFMYITLQIEGKVAAGTKYNDDIVDVLSLAQLITVKF